MKKIITTIVLATFVLMPSYAQNYTHSKYYNRSTGRLDYGRGARGSYINRDTYFGFRVGPAFTTVNSDNVWLDGGKTKTGINVGVAAGFALTNQMPLFLESGLYYVEKGGKNKTKGYDFTCNLGYLEVPFVLKYVYNVDRTISLQPFFGGYLSCGVAGKIKDFNGREAYDSFDDDDDGAFKRFDGGLRMGVGIGIDMFYADLTYDLGLANVGADDFDDAHNSAVMLTFGINF